MKGWMLADENDPDDGPTIIDEPPFNTPLLDSYVAMPSHLAELRLTLLQVGATAMRTSVLEECTPYLRAPIARAGAIAVVAANSLESDAIREAMTTLRALGEFIGLAELERIFWIAAWHEPHLAFPATRTAVRLVDFPYA